MLEDIKKYGTIDVSYYKEMFKRHDDWDNELSQFRANKYSVHSATQTIPLQLTDENLYDRPKVAAPRSQFWDKYYDQFFFDELFDIFKKQISEGYPVRILFTKLKANSSISRHRDMSPSLYENHRVHIPIVTNDNVIFGVRNTEVNMREGEIYEFNNAREHYVNNNSNQDRIHLIVDWHSTA